MKDLVIRPTRNPQPVGDTVWTFLDPSGGLAASVLRDEGGETGLELARTTVIEFATPHRFVDLQIVVGPGPATLSVEATTLGGRVAASLPETNYPEGIHPLSLLDYCLDGCGDHIRRIRLSLPSGKVIVTRVCTAKAEN